jgi:hypothetical protein
VTRRRGIRRFQTKDRTGGFLLAVGPLAPRTIPPQHPTIWLLGGEPVVVVESSRSPPTLPERRRRARHNPRLDLGLKRQAYQLYQIERCRFPIDLMFSAVKRWVLTFFRFEKTYSCNTEQLFFSPASTR